MGAAAAYLGLKRGSSATKELEPVSSYGASNTVPDSAYTVGKEQSVQDSAFVEGQAAVVNDEAYAAGYKQGKDLYQGIDKNSTQHRDALLGANTTSANEGTKTLDPSAGGSASQTGGLFQSTKDAAIGATVAAAGALGLGGAAAATSGISSSDKTKTHWLMLILQEDPKVRPTLSLLVDMLVMKMILPKKLTKLVKIRHFLNIMLLLVLVLILLKHWLFGCCRCYSCWGSWCSWCYSCWWQIVKRTRC